MIEQIPTADLIPYARNARTHSEQQVSQIAGSIQEFGFCNPVLIDATNGIIAGHGRVMAAQVLKLETVPCLRLSHLTDAQKRAYVLADNRIALSSGWDSEMLANELSDLHADEFDMALLGFDADELATLMGLDEESKRDEELKTAVAQSLQVIPGKEYCVILCDGETEWAELRRLLGLGLVSRGGYKDGSPFNSVGAERVITMQRLLERIRNVDSNPI
tara:strand:+ start:102 stop:755 length:654 start_codon:yes stop_codon:yes gene_type:complete